jgi:DNA-binding MarR family transcriptional regulator
VQNAHIATRVRALHEALIDIVGVLNRPQGDAMMVREAGLSLHRALFPLLVVIERRGPIGVVELAERAGRDYTTVSRQVAKLENLGLIERRSGENDRRVHEVFVSGKGKAMTDALDEARVRIVGAMFATWDDREIDDLVRLMRKLADAMKEGIAC